MDQNAELYRRLRILFDDVVQKPPLARQTCLNQICDEDPALYRELIRLLVAHEEASSFLERPIGSLASDGIATDDFSTTDRFAVLRRLGAGGMGVVYEVEDLVRGEIVALKTMRRATPAAVYWLKQEFRSLAGISHPNLVCLYELIVEQERCFFTMELVKGVNFVQYVRQEANTSLSVDRLRSALRQLIDGIATLHRLGKLHRDIKPSNVLVSPEGRLVILDFGLIAESVPAVLGITEHHAGGTPAYVSPEEVAGLPPSEAGDWYGVGATLYEALTGNVPFSGSTVEVLLCKRHRDPPSPREIAPNVPADVSSVCMDLLCRDPARRLSGVTPLVGSVTTSSDRTLSRHHRWSSRRLRSWAANVSSRHWKQHFGRSVRLVQRVSPCAALPESARLPYCDAFSADCAHATMSLFSSGAAMSTSPCPTKR